MIPHNHKVWKSLLTMVGFGILSLALGYIRFVVPGIEGGGSDMREISILVSVLYLPSWIYMLGVSFITSLSPPVQHLEISTILMHCTASLFAWFFYAYIKNRVSNLYLLGGLWALMVVAYYTIFLIPTMAIVFYLLKAINENEILSTYKNVLYYYRFELFTSTTVTTLFLVLLKTTRILKVKNKELEVALLKSEESDRLKTAFLANINHEIRTPLNGIVGFTNLIIEPDLTQEDRVDYGNMIKSNSNQLLLIISDIIDLSKIKSGQLILNNESISVSELFDSLSHYYSTIAEGKKLHFEVRYEGIGSNDIIITDMNCLKQILENLLNNAFKFTEKGYVRLYFKEANELATFIVEDSGPGIAPSLYEKIFEDFSKFQNNENNFHEGTGLGLAISKALVDLMGGTINITSEIGKGSIFSITIPCNRK